MLDSKSNNVEEVLNSKGEIVVCTSGISMYPMLRNRRDTVVIKKADSELKCNDVALYRIDSGKLVLHRIIKITSNCYIIRGDNLYKKEYVEKEKVFGSLKGFYRDGKYINCNTDKGYKLYILYLKLSFPIRFIVFGKLRPLCSKIKHFIKKKIHRK